MSLLIRWSWLVISIASLIACGSIEPQRDRAGQAALLPPAGQLWPGLQHGGGDKLVPLNIGPQALQWRLRALRTATSSIDLQTFIWKDDGVGLALGREVVAAAERGVRVRILLDDSFLVHADEGLKTLSSHPNISYRIYNPVARRSNNVFLREVENISDFARINHRMHNKLLVVDGQLAIIGGRNQAEEYFGYHPRHNFRDFELLVSGPFLSQLEAVFDLYWNDPWSLAIEDLLPGDNDSSFSSIQAWLQEHAADHHELANSATLDWEVLFKGAFDAELDLIVDTPPDKGPAFDVPVQLAEALVVRMDAVQHDMILVSAYFIPTKALTDAIERAIARGVRVRILTNSLGSNNHVSAHAAYVAHRPALLRAGAELYELRSDAASRALYLDDNTTGAMLGLHEKGALFDSCCLFVGSANLDPRSLRQNTEVGMLIDSPELNARVRHLLEVDLRAENAWRVELQGSGDVVWIGERGVQRHSPPASFFLRAESWFFGLLPIEGQM